MSNSRTIDYQIDGQTYEGFFKTPNGNGPFPLVVIAHAWGGLSDNERQKADMIVDMGYAAFCMDVYGKGRRGQTVEECQALMTPLAENRAELQKRLKASLKVAKSQSGVDPIRSAAIGYCFGGLSVIDMARAGMDILGACSFHGLLGAPGNTDGNKISAKLLIEHGWMDPMAPPEDVIAIAKELGDAGADWQLHAHGTAVHAFTTKGANNPDMGTVYQEAANTRSVENLKNFLAELF